MQAERKVNNTYRKQSPEARLFHSAKSRAKQLGLPFNIDMADCHVPEYCPILGIPLNMEAEERTDNTPSIDRIIPERGYVKGNVVVISWRANRLKNNATVEELMKLASFYGRLVHHLEPIRVE